MAAATKEILADLSPVIIHYADGTVHRLLGSAHVPPSPEDPVSSRDVTIPGSGVAPSARLYLPKTAAEGKKLPIVVYYHGGAFCVDSAFSLLNHRYATAFSPESGSLVVSVEYRLAPEHHLPAAYEDSWAALTWVCSQAVNEDPWIAEHGDLTKLFVAGDSAGGNIAHNMAMRAGSEPLPGNVRLRGAILGHPYFWGRTEELHMCERLWLFAYPGCSGGIENPMINPVADGAPSLSGLGCTRLLVYVAEKDVLKPWGLRYVEKVKESGWNGSVEAVEAQGEDHCFQVFDPSTAKAKELITNIAHFIAHT